MFRPLSIIGSWFTDFSDRQQKKQITVVGYGWATHAFMQRIDHRKYNVQVISERVSRLNQPGLVAAIPDTSMASLFTEPVCPVVEDSCLSVDLSANRVLGAKGEYPYDLLVIAAGSEVNDFKIPGIRAFCHMFKTEHDLRSLQAALPSKKSVVVMGAGPTGIELACRLRSMGFTVAIIEASHQILPGFSEAMQKRTERILKENGITVHRGSPIQGVTESVIRTKGADLPWTQGSELLVWTCGVKPVPFVAHFRVNGSLQVEGASNVWMLGDCVTSRLLGPPTAQNARQQGDYLADQLNGQLNGSNSQLKPYTYHELGRILDLTYGYLIEVYGFCFYIPTDFFMQVAF
jgi:NADH:ubiquinone reductase (non-electrogenic)